MKFTVYAMHRKAESDEFGVVGQFSPISVKMIPIGLVHAMTADDALKAAKKDGIQLPIVGPYQAGELVKQTPVSKLLRGQAAQSPKKAGKNVTH